MNPPKMHSNNHNHNGNKNTYDQQNQYQMGPQPTTVQGFNQLPVQQSQQSQQGDILQKIDSLLDQDQNNQVYDSTSNNNKTNQREVLLNMKLNEMQKIIQNLNEANKKLNRKLDQCYTEQQQNRNNENNESSNMLNSSSQSNVPFNDELTEMQGDFQQIEGLIQQYKNQLTNSEQKWNTLKEEKDQEIQSLKNQILVLSDNNQLLQNEITLRLQENQMLANKNQQLLIQLQNLEQQLQRRSQQYSQHNYPSPSNRYYYQTPAKKFDSLEDYRFNQKIERQMETMIKKLLKELSTQKKVNQKMSLEIKRLNNELLDLQKKMKHKNATIYHLQMKLISIEKTYNIATNRRHNTLNTSNINSPNKYSTILVDKPIHLTPSQNNNPKSRIYQQNRYDSKLPLNQRSKPQQQQILMNHYQPQDYTQYSDQQSNNYEQNPYEDYVLNSVPIKSMRNPTKIKEQNLLYNGANINKQILKGNSQINTQQARFVKQKKRTDQTGKQSRKIHQQQNANQSGQKLQSTKQFLSFTLMQLQEGKLQITMKQKIIIISRLIDLYCKKIKTKNYYNLIAEQIQVYNFNQKHPNLIRIRIVDAHSNNSKADISSTLQEDTEESLMYNLAFIVENLVKQVQTSDQNGLEVDLNLTEIIEEILTKSLEDKIAYFQELSKSLESSVNTLH